MTDCHAYLIIAHNQFDLLKKVIKMLDHPKHHIYVHISKKVKNFPKDEFDGLTKYSPVVFTPRVPVSWGAYSQVESELTLIDSAISKEYGFYHIISGVDMPLKTADEIYNFFEANKGKEFVEFMTDDENIATDQFVENTKNRINSYQLFRQYIPRNKDTFLKRQQSRLIYWQKRFGVDRVKTLDRKIGRGSNWISISHELASYIIANRKWIKKHFNYTFCCDEIFLQTLMEGTDFKNRLYADKDGRRANMRFIDWERGRPYTFTDDDYDELMSSGYMFARKFDSGKYPEICEIIYKTVMERQLQ